MVHGHKEPTSTTADINTQAVRYHINDEKKNINDIDTYNQNIKAIVKKLLPTNSSDYYSVILSRIDFNIDELIDSNDVLLGLFEIFRVVLDSIDEKISGRPINEEIFEKKKKELRRLIIMSSYITKIRNDQISSQSGFVDSSSNIDSKLHTAMLVVKDALNHEIATFGKCIDNMQNIIDEIDEIHFN